MPSPAVRGSCRRLQYDRPGFSPDYGNIVQDSAGYLWIFTRVDQQGTAHCSRKPNDIRACMQRSVCVPVKGRHALDAAALDKGRLYAVSLLTTDGRMYGTLYDGKKWGETPVLIAAGLTRATGG